MSVESITSGGSAFSSSRSTWRGCKYWPPLKGVSPFCSSIISRLYGSVSCVQASSSRSQAAFSAWIFAARSAFVASDTSVRPCNRSSSASAAAFASPQMPTEIFFTSPSILLSASTWMICAAFGQ